MPVGRKLFVNVAILGGYKVAGDLFVFAMFIAVARHYGSAGLGEYAFAMAATSFAAMICNFGFEFYAVREVARDPARESAIFGTLTLAGLALVALCSASVLGLAALVRADSDRGALIASIGLYQVLYCFSGVLTGRFKARSEMGVVGLLEFGLRFGVLAGMLVAIRLDLPLVRAMWIFPLAAAAHIATAAAVLARRRRPLRWRLDRGVLARAWPELWPFGLALLLQSAYMKIDVLVLGVLSSDAELGLYAAAFRPIFGLLTIANVASSATYPIFSKLYVDARAQLREQIARVVSYFLLAVALAALFCACAAAPLMRLLYGDGFASSVAIFRILALNLVVSSLTFVFHRFLGAVNRQRAFLQAMAIGICLNTGLCVLLASRFGALGAACATLASEITTLCLLYRHALAADCGVGLARQLARAALGAAAGLLAWHFVRGAAGPAVGDWLGALTALPVCCAAMAALGAVPRADLESARALLRTRWRERSIG